MSKNNQYFKGKKVLDAMSESYADEVFETFETLRNMGFRISRIGIILQWYAHVQIKMRQHLLLIFLIVRQ